MSYQQTVDEPCGEGQEILGSIKATIDHIAVLHSLEIDAVSKGDMTEWEAIGITFHKATEFRDSLLERYELHLQGHECP